MTIVIQGGITIGPGVSIGNYPVFVTINDFITEDSNNLITENNNQLIEET